jgi:hypothetical protein
VLLLVLFESQLDTGADSRFDPGSGPRAGRPASLYDQTLDGKLSRAAAAAVLRA